MIGRGLYILFRLLCRFIFVQTVRLKSARLEEAQRQGGYVLAVTHLSHLEPVFVSTILSRRISWITRKEFYRNRFLCWLLDVLSCIKVNRQGVPVSTIRQAIAHAKAGQIVGIFPEGGVARGRASVLREGTLRAGAASIAIHARVPIIPCVILNAQEFMKVRPWVPLRRGRLWVAFGDPIWPAGVRSTRAARQRLLQRLSDELREVHRQMVCRWGVHEPMLLDDAFCLATEPA